MPRASVSLGPQTSEADFQAVVDGSAQHPRREQLLLELLEESAPVYQGRGARAITRMRGYLLAELGRHGTPAAALPFVLAELENGRDPYSVAAAARAVRGLQPAPAVAVPYLLQGLLSIQLRDDALTFERYAARGFEPEPTSAVSEIVASLVWLGVAVRPWLDDIRKLVTRADSPLPAGARAALQELVSSTETAPAGDSDCCRPLSALLEASRARQSRGSFRRARAVDQEGRSLHLAEHCHGKVSLVAFFYTRCDNPNKCSLTISRLARLQRALRQLPWAQGVQLLGISYDPAYDSPALLKTYGASRGFSFGERDRFLRVQVEDFAELSRFFELGVSYAGSIVNHHAIELYLLDAEARPMHCFKRLRWDDAEVLALAEAAVEAAQRAKPWRWLRRAAGAVSSLALGLAIVFFPKCPLCWAAYLGVFGVVGASALPYSPWLQPVLVLMLLVNVALLGRGVFRQRGGPLFAWRLGFGYEPPSPMGPETSLHSNERNQ